MSRHHPETVSIPIDFTEGELARIARAAHIQNVTINDFMVGALEATTSEILNTTEDIAELQEKYTEVDKKEAFFEDIHMLSSLLNTTIEEGMTSMDLTGEELKWLAKALDDSFSVYEIATKMGQYGM